MANRWILATHPRTREAWPAAWSPVTRRTTPTSTAEPGIDRMKNRPRSWAISP